MFQDTNIWLILPMILTVVGACVCLIGSTFKSFVNDKGLFWTAMVFLAVVLLELILRLHSPFALAFGHSVQFDDEATLLKIVITILVGVTLIYGRETLEVMKAQMGEFYTLVLLSMSGMFLLVSAMNLLTIFLGIELMSLPLYALVALYRREGEATEAALKYFVMGALSSGLLLFGFSLLYGATGYLDLIALQHHFLTYDGGDIMAAMACVFIVAGLAFKLGLAPFHMWVPDVYEAAPTPVTCLIATAPKVAMVGLLLHLFVQTLQFNQWATLWTSVALLSVVWGNLAALVQKNFKRMIAYSSVAHMGILVLGMINNNHAGAKVMMFYIITYGLTTTVVLGACMLLQNNYQNAELIDDFKGLNRVFPGQAFFLMLGLFSLAGVPPLVGFMAKFSILDTMLKSGHTAWAVVVVLAAVVGAFYYIRVIKAMYFEKAEQEGGLLLIGGRLVRGCYTLNGFALLLLGVVPGLLYHIILHTLA